MPNGNGLHLNCQGRSVIRDAAETTIVCLWKGCCGWFGQVRRGAICRTNLANGTPSTRASGGGRKRTCGSGFSSTCPRIQISNTSSSMRRWSGSISMAPAQKGDSKSGHRRPHDGTIITDKVNEMWGTDMTQTITIREGRANVFVAVEHANSEVVGIHASRSANRFEALEPVRQGVHRCFGAIAPGVARGLKLRHDHGSNYMSGDFQDEIECLGIEASPSFVRQPEGNGVAERFIRTLKENLLWVRTFDTIEELRAALVEFATRYNETWLVARHGYRTPAQVRADQSRVDQTVTTDISLAA